MFGSRLRMEYSFGNDQVGVVGQKLKPFIVQCVREDGGRISDLAIDWHIVSGSGEFTELKDTHPDKFGFANAEFIPAIPGRYRVKCVAEDTMLSFIGHIVPATEEDDAGFRPNENPVSVDGADEGTNAASPQADRAELAPIPAEVPAMPLTESTDEAAEHGATAGSHPPPLPLTDPKAKFWGDEPLAITYAPSEPADDKTTAPERPDQRYVKTEKIVRSPRPGRVRRLIRRVRDGDHDVFLRTVYGSLVLGLICMIIFTMLHDPGQPGKIYARNPVMLPAAALNSKIEQEAAPVAVKPEPTKPSAPAVIDCTHAAWRVEGDYVIYSCPR